MTTLTARPAPAVFPHAADLVAARARRDALRTAIETLRDEPFGVQSVYERRHAMQRPALELADVELAITRLEEAEAGGVLSPDLGAIVLRRYALMDQIRTLEAQRSQGLLTDLAFGTARIPLLEALQAAQLAEDQTRDAARGRRQEIPS